jgi:hypothetical protein
MSTYRLGLLFQPHGKKDLPGPASSHVYVKTLSKEGDLILISPRALSFSEFRGYLNELREELDALEKEAKKKYASDPGGPAPKPKDRQRTYRDIVGKLPREEKPEDPDYV